MGTKIHVHHHIIRSHKAVYVTHARAGVCVSVHACMRACVCAYLRVCARERYV